SKNSSRLELTMHRYRSRSRTGVLAFSAMASTRSLNLSKDNSRFSKVGLDEEGSIRRACSKEEIVLLQFCFIYMTRPAKPASRIHNCQFARTSRIAEWFRAETDGPSL